MERNRNRNKKGGMGQGKMLDVGSQNLKCFSWQISASAPGLVNPRYPLGTVKLILDILFSTTNIFPRLKVFSCCIIFSWRWWLTSLPLDEEIEKYKYLHRLLPLNITSFSFFVVLPKQRTVNTPRNFFTFSFRCFACFIVEGKTAVNIFSLNFSRRKLDLYVNNRKRSMILATRKKSFLDSFRRKLWASMQASS